MQFQLLKCFKLNKFNYIILVAKLTSFFKHFEDLLLDSKSTFKVLRSTKITDNRKVNPISKAV